MENGLPLLFECFNVFVTWSGLTYGLSRLNPRLSNPRGSPENYGTHRVNCRYV